MRVIYDLGKITPPFKNPVVAIGVFDGIHIGHQKLIGEVVRRAREFNGTPIVMTFDPHPVRVLHPEVQLHLIVSLPHRLRLLKELGVKAVMVIPFTKKFSRLSPGTFIKDYLLNPLYPAEILVGDDFRFGQNRLGTIEIFERYAKRFHFKVNAVVPVPGDLGKVSSTQIRHLIIEGNLKKASRLLGRPVSVMGKVIMGDKRGKKLGFPTANLKPESELIPPKGVYATRVEVGGRMYEGMTNIGQRPSFTPIDERILVETHIFNFNRTLYGQTILVYFIKKIRDEKYFPSVDKLIVQLKKDERAAKEILRTQRSQIVRRANEAEGNYRKGKIKTGNVAKLTNELNDEVY